MSTIEIFLNEQKSNFSLEDIPETLQKFKIALVNLFDFPKTIGFDDMKLFYLDEDEEKICLNSEQDYNVFKEEQKHVIFIRINSEKLNQKPQNEEICPLLIYEEETESEQQEIEGKIKKIVTKHLQDILPGITNKIMSFYEESKEKCQEQPQKKQDLKIFIDQEAQTEDFLLEELITRKIQQNQHKTNVSILEKPEKKPNDVPKQEEKKEDYSQFILNGSSVSSKNNEKTPEFEIISSTFHDEIITPALQTIKMTLKLKNLSDIPIEKNKYSLRIPKTYYLHGETLNLPSFEPKETKNLMFSLKNPGTDGRFGCFFEVFNRETEEIINLKGMSIVFDVKEPTKPVILIPVPKELQAKVKEIQEILNLSEQEYQQMIEYIKKNPNETVDNMVNFYYDGNKFV